MQQLWKVLIPLGIVAVVAIIFMARPRPDVPAGETNAPTNQTSETAPEKQGGVSLDSNADSVANTSDEALDAVSAELLAGAEADSSAFDQETLDGSLFSNDSAELNSLLNTYDANQF